MNESRWTWYEPYRSVRILLACSVILLGALAAGGAPPADSTDRDGENVSIRAGQMVPLPRGRYIPLYTSDTNFVDVDSFLIDVYPVTVQEFVGFLRNNPHWRRSQIKAIFADDAYLADWAGDLEPGEAAPNSPVTGVSWFAAKAYCECKGKQLPTNDQWEYAGMASETNVMGATEPAFYQNILDWYSRPTPARLPAVGSTFQNVYGVWDMHGLIWEWVLDFNSALLTGESRGDVGLDRNLFCAGGSVGATDVSNYAAYMRYAFRASLKANYAVASLGFRCARPIRSQRGKEQGR